MQQNMIECDLCHKLIPEKFLERITSQVQQRNMGIDDGRLGDAHVCKQWHGCRSKGKKED